MLWCAASPCWLVQTDAVVLSSVDLFTGKILGIKTVDISSGKYFMHMFTKCNQDVFDWTSLTKTLLFHHQCFERQILYLCVSDGHLVVAWD